LPRSSADEATINGVTPLNRLAPAAKTGQALIGRRWEFLNVHSIYSLFDEGSPARQSDDGASGKQYLCNSNWAAVDVREICRRLRPARSFVQLFAAKLAVRKCARVGKACLQIFNKSRSIAAFGQD